MGSSSPGLPGLSHSPSRCAPGRGERGLRCSWSPGGGAAQRASSALGVSAGCSALSAAAAEARGRVFRPTVRWASCPLKLCWAWPQDPLCACCLLRAPPWRSPWRRGFSSPTRSANLLGATRGACSAAMLIASPGRRTVSPPATATRSASSPASDAPKFARTAAKAREAVMQELTVRREPRVMLGAPTMGTRR